MARRCGGHAASQCDRLVTRIGDFSSPSAPASEAICALICLSPCSNRISAIARRREATECCRQSRTPKSR